MVHPEVLAIQTHSFEPIIKLIKISIKKRGGKKRVILTNFSTSSFSLFLYPSKQIVWPDKA